MSLSSSVHAHETLNSAFTSEVAQDIQNNFAEKISSVSNSNNQDDSILSARDEKVMMKALYLGIEGPLSLAGVHISEQSFYSKVGGLLVKGAKFGAIPAAITIGFFRSADLIVGKTYATEMNFYLDQGNLKVSTYDLNTTNVGPIADLVVGYYVALCFGSCTGKEASGLYVDVNADVIYGAGANIYIEVGVDTSDFYQAKKDGKSYSLSNLYKTKTVYIGAGINIGEGWGYAMGFSKYTLKSDQLIVDLYALMNQQNFRTNVKSAFNDAHLFKSAPRLP